MPTDPQPALTVVVLTPDTLDTIRHTLRHLQQQTIRERLEVIIVAPQPERLAAGCPELSGLRWRVIAGDPARSSAAARAAGVRQARAPLVAVTEDHTFPEPQWAEALLQAHSGPYAVVGSVMTNANPDSLVSWANLLIEYAPWLHPVEPHEVDHVPWHNSAYKRSVLLNYGAELESMLEAESILHWDLRAKGQRLFLEPEARVGHLNFSRLWPSLALRFAGGRLFGAARCHHWSPLRRLAYVIGGPLIPWVRLVRLWRELHRPGRPRHLLPRILPLLLCLTFDAAGEMAGYALGMGQAAQQVTAFEFNRLRYLNEADRQQWALSAEG